MLTKTLSVFALLPLTAVGVVALGQAEAGAAPCKGRGGDTTDCKAVIRLPGRTGKTRTPTGGGGTIIADPCANDPACAGGNLQGPPAPQPTTADAVQIALASMTVPKPRLHTSPNGRTYVEMETFLWVDRRQWKPMTVPAKVPGQTIEATAAPTGVEWNLGEKTITCTGPGKPYNPKGPKNQTSPCSYTYERSSAGQPGGRYQISATINWTVSWTCTGAAGACDAPGGQLPAMATTSFAQLPVGEIQTSSRPD